MTEAQPPRTETKFGRYTITEPLAKGGMAQIYKAKTAAGRTFTLKKILKDYSDNADFIQMFLEEAKISLSLKHPNVIRVLDFGQLEGSYFLAMEYVFGRDVSALLKKCAESRLYIPLEVVCHIIYQCCLGLDYAHSQRDSFGNPLGIVHRDISPPNILISYNGEVKILDFGIAKAISGARSREETRTGVLKGKFSYMSPEQASGKPLNAQSDLFSLGTVFYELLTTRNLFYMPDEIETLERVRKADVPSPAKVRKDIPPALEKIVMKALALKPKNRFSSCGEMADAIYQFLQNYYPRSDSRSVAKFLRGVFSADYQNRFKSAVGEGWQDVLEVGGTDDELMLDANEPSTFRSGYRSVRTGQVPIQWYQRILYDPKTKAEFWKTVSKSLLGLVFVAAGIYGFHLYRTGALNDLLSKARQDNAELPKLPTKAEAKTEEAPFGIFLYWVKQGTQAEERSDYQAALSAYNQALEINAFEASVQTKKNFMMLAVGRIDEGCRYFQKQSELSTEDRILSAAICQEANGELQEAVGTYSDFLTRFPEDRRADRVRSVLAALKNRGKE